MGVGVLWGKGTAGRRSVVLGGSLRKWIDRQRPCVPTVGMVSSTASMSLRMAFFPRSSSLPWVGWLVGLGFELNMCGLNECTVRTNINEVAQVGHPTNQPNPPHKHPRPRKY